MAESLGSRLRVAGRHLRPVCERCWLDENAVWEPESISEDGRILMSLKSVQVPEKLNTGEPESCSRCDGLTIAGIYLLSSTATRYGQDEYDDQDDDGLWVEDNDED
jgi:hypothetical protein